MVDKTGYIPKAPMNVDIELAGKCQLACTMCPYGTGSFDEAKQGMMSDTMVKDVLWQAWSLGVKSIKFNFRGESGLCKNLEKYIEIANQLGFVDIFINTNMLAFSKERLKNLKGLTKLIVSIDGTNKEDYEKIRINGDYNKLIDNIHYFSKHKGNTKLILQMVSETPDRKLEQIPADEYRYVKVQDRGQGAEGNTGERRRCPQPRQRLVVAWDGTIFPCCSNWNNEWPLGNIKDITLKEAWNNKRMQELRQISTKCDAFPCKGCQVAGSYK